MAPISLRAPLLLLLAILPLFAGCGVVVSKNPLSSPHGAVRDKRLEGMWRVEDGKGVYRYVFIAYNPAGNGVIYQLEKTGTSGPGLSTATYVFFVTRTPKDNFLNIREGAPNNQLASTVTGSGAYMFAEYHFTWLGQLSYSMVAASDAFGNAIDSGKLKGKVERDKNKVTDVLLTDSSKHILDFIESSKPKDVFGPPSKLSWIGPP